MSAGLRPLLRCLCGSCWFTVAAVNLDAETLAVVGHTAPEKCGRCGRPCDVAPKEGPDNDG